MNRNYSINGRRSVLHVLGAVVLVLSLAGCPNLFESGDSSGGDGGGGVTDNEEGGTVPEQASNLISRIVPEGVRIAWTDNADNENTYVISRSTNGTDFTVLAQLDPDSDSYVDGTADQNVNYTYRVIAQNAAGDSDPLDGVFTGAIGSGTSRIVGSIALPADTSGSVADAEVFIVGQTNRAVRTAEDGSFVLEIVNSTVGSIVATSTELTNTYQLVVRTSDGRFGTKRDAITVEDRSTKTLSSPLQTEVTGSISGRFTKQGQSDSAGVLVYIPGTRYTAVTEADGAVTLTNVPPGAYNYVRADADGYASALVPEVTVTADSDTTIGGRELVPTLGDGGGMTINNGETHSTSLEVTLTLDPPFDAVRMKVSEDNSFVDIPYEPISTSRSYTFDSNGTKEVFVQFENADATETLVSDTITVETNPKVVLESPGSEEATTDATPKLEWSDGPALTDGVTYLLTVATSEEVDADGILVDSISGVSFGPSNALETSEFEVPGTKALDDGTYYWQIAMLQAGETVWNWTAPQSFTLSIGTVTPTELSASGYVGTRRPRFSWSQNENATGYRLVVSESEDLSTSVAAAGPSILAAGTTSYRLTTPQALDGANGTTYYWAVTPVQGEGVGTASATQNLVLDTAQPTATPVILSDVDTNNEFTYQTAVSVDTNAADLQFTLNETNNLQYRYAVFADYPDMLSESQLADTVDRTAATVTSTLSSGSLQPTLDEKNWSNLPSSGVIESIELAGSQRGYRYVVVQLRDGSSPPNQSDPLYDVIFYEDAVHVSLNGNDTNSGAWFHENKAPVGTIEAAVQLAKNHGLSEIRLAGTGVYVTNDPITVDQPISIRGGYDPTFVPVAENAPTIAGTDLDYVLKYDGGLTPESNSRSDVDETELKQRLADSSISKIKLKNTVIYSGNANKEDPNTMTTDATRPAQPVVLMLEANSVGISDVQVIGEYGSIYSSSVTFSTVAAGVDMLLYDGSVDALTISFNVPTGHTYNAILGFIPGGEPQLTATAVINPGGGPPPTATAIAGLREDSSDPTVTNTDISSGLGWRDIPPTAGSAVIASPGAGALESGIEILANSPGNGGNELIGNEIDDFPASTYVLAFPPSKFEFEFDQ